MIVKNVLLEKSIISRSGAVIYGHVMFHVMFLLGTPVPPGRHYETLSASISPPLLLHPGKIKSRNLVFAIFGGNFFVFCTILAAFLQSSETILLILSIGQDMALASPTSLKAKFYCFFFLQR